LCHKEAQKTQRAPIICAFCASLWLISIRRQEDLQDRSSPVAHRPPTTRTVATSFRWVQRSALLLARCRKSPAQLAPPAPSLLSASHRAGAHECTSVRRD